MSVTPDVARVLNDAADLIEQKGWVQEVDAVDDEGDDIDARSDWAVAFCAGGAICAALGATDASARTIVDHVARLCGVSYLYEWNDAPGRTQAEVVAKLREVAAA